MEEQRYLRVELKYCELCGGLWLRQEGSGEVYCNWCAPEMAQVARGAKKQAASVKWEAIRGGAVCA